MDNNTKDEKQRSVPSNIEAEQMLLGAILINNEVINQIIDFLESDHFYVSLHKDIYSAIIKILDKGFSADVISIKNMLKNEDISVEKETNEYLAKIVTLATAIINPLDYANIIYDLAKKRRLIDLGEKIVNNAYDSTLVESAVDQIENAESSLYDLSQDKDSNKGFVSISSTVSSSLDVIDLAMKNQSSITGISTGFSKLDEKLSGLHNSDLVIIAGRPSMGKTAFAINLAMSACNYCIDKHKKDNLNEGQVPSVGIFSLEMSTEQLAMRIISMQTLLNSSMLKAGKINESQYNILREEAEKLSSFPLFIDDTPALSISALRTRARRLKRKHNLGILFIDYLQLLRPSQGKSDNRVLEISEITQGLKAIAKELNIPVIALSQLSRAVEQREDKRPLLSDLRESGSIEQDADIVMFLYREDYYLARREPAEGSPKHDEWQKELANVHNRMDIIIAKHRNGPIGTIPLFYDINHSRFRNYNATKEKSDS